MKIILIMALFFSALLADRDGGPYIGLGYGTSSYDDDNYYTDIKESNSKAASIYGGAYINKHLSVEVGYANFGSSSDGFLVDNSGTDNSLSFSAFTVSTLGHYAFFDDVLDVYARAGVGQMSSSELDMSNFTAQFGAGIGIRINEWLSVKVAYDIYKFTYEDPVSSTGHDMSIDYMYAAVEVQF